MLAGVGLLAPFGALVGLVNHAAAAIAITCMIAFLCQSWSTNMATLAADLFPGSETASVVGMMGTAGSLGGVCFSQVLGLLIAGLGYPAAFMLAAFLHPVATIVLFTMLRPATIK